MTLEELFRRVVRAHLPLIAACVLVPLLAVVYMQSRHQESWVATVRLQVRASAPTSTTEADGMSSRVLALATTPDIVADALREGHVRGNPAEIAQHHVVSQRLGESPVVELSVDNPDRRIAARQVTALAQRVAWFMNRESQTGLDTALTDAQSQLARATTQRNNLAEELARTPRGSRHDLLQSQLSAAQATVDQLAASASSITLQRAGQDEVTVIDPDRPQLAPTPSTLVPRGILAVLLGLLVGAAAAVLAETMRPRVAGIRAVARLLDAPVLGSVRDRSAALANTLTLAARRQGVETVVLLGVDPSDEAVALRLLRVFTASSLVAHQPSTTSVPAYSPAHDDALAEGPSLPMQIKFTSLAEVSAADERTAGLVIVSSDSPRQRDIDTLEDIIRAMRWPVVGVVDSSNRRRLHKDST